MWLSLLTLLITLISALPALISLIQNLKGQGKQLPARHAHKFSVVRGLCQRLDGLLGTMGVPSPDVSEVDALVEGAIQEE